jgi:hypothetical protein
MKLKKYLTENSDHLVVNKIHAEYNQVLKEYIHN